MSHPLLQVLRKTMQSMEIMRSIYTCCLSFLLLLLPFCVVQADPVSIQIKKQRDYEVLNLFFKMGIAEEEYGYVLEGAKPISIRVFYPLDDFIVTKNLEHGENEFANTLLVREAIPIWNRLCSSQKQFVLKAVPLNTLGSSELGWEVAFINLSKLQEVIENNIDLFRYILGPLVQPKQLVEKIGYSQEILSHILCNDRVLIGIVLGFGPHNSIVGGRKETIHALSISRDMAPFTSKSPVMDGQKQYYGSYYLDVAGGDDSLENFRNDFSHLKPSMGFKRIEDEFLALKDANELLPSPLIEKPAFIFGAYKGGPSNQSLFKQLTKSQKQSQKLLKRADFLHQVLQKIGGKKPLITCKELSPSSLQLSFFQNSLDAQTWNHVLNKVIHRFDDQQKLVFIDSFLDSSISSVPTPAMTGVSKATLNGLKTALYNLSVTNAHFELHAKDTSLKSIVPRQLYFKTIAKGSGKELHNAARIRLNYVITDAEENILFAHHDTWLSLSQTIPGFAHGMLGMCVGEKRKIFIHPSLAYGALTTLPPCIELIAKIQLLDIDEHLSEQLPALTSLDLSWIQDPGIYLTIEESIRQQPGFIGMFYRNLLDKIEGPGKTNILEKLDCVPLNNP